MKEFGEYLRNERLARGVTLEEIERRTRIRKQHLTAIEAGEFHRLPEAAYVKAFLRHYANCVGLDAKTVVEQYEQLHGASAASEVAATAVSGRSERRLRQLRARRRRRIWQWVVLLLIVLGGLGIYFYNDIYQWVSDLPFLARSEQTEVQESSSPEPAAGEPTEEETLPQESAVPSWSEQERVAQSDTTVDELPVASNAQYTSQQSSLETPQQESQQADASTDETAISVDADEEIATELALSRPIDLQTDPVVVPGSLESGFTLGLSASDVSWAEMHVDGERVLYRNLAPGEHVSYVVQREASLRLGRAGEVEIDVNEEPVGLIGEGVASRRFISELSE